MGVGWWDIFQGVSYADAFQMASAVAVEVGYHERWLLTAGRCRCNGPAPYG